jgi:replicative DNA helicase
MRFIGEVEEGMKGRYRGLDTNMSRLSKFINGIQKRTYYAIGAQPKSGKTALVDEFFVLGPYLQNKDANIKWIYFSPEVDLLEKMAKYTAYFMDAKYGVYCDSNYVLSRGDNRLTPEHKKLVDEIAQNELKDLFGNKIHFIEDRVNPEGIRQTLFKHAEENGTFIREPWKDKQGKTREKIVGYEENDKSLYTIIIVDHVGLVPLQQGFTKKQNIDELSSRMVWFRNICNFSPVLVSQFNRELGKIDRLKFSGEQLSPTLEDFKDTGGLSEDASLVMGIFNPTQHKHLERHLNYDLNGIGKSYRSIHVLASRNTEANVSISAIIEGKTGRFKELPRPHEQEALNKVYEYVEQKGLK